VDERGSVNDFHDRPQLDRAASFVIEQLGGQQQKGRPQPFAASAAQVLTNLGDGGDAGHRIAPEFALDGGKIIAKKLENFCAVNGCCAHFSFSTRKHGTEKQEVLDRSCSTPQTALRLAPCLSASVVNQLLR